MVDGKYLSDDDVINVFDIVPGQLNLLRSNCGSGKSTFVFEKLLPYEYDWNRCLYLIDTTVGRDQKLKDFLETQSWDPNFEKVINDEEIIFDPDDRMFVMTYAKFGLLCQANKKFSSYFNLIIADEFHNCIKYIDYDKAKICKENRGIAEGIHSKNKEQRKRAYDKMNSILALTSCHYIAMENIAMTALNQRYNGKYWCPRHDPDDARVLAITATPKKVYEKFDFMINEVTASCQIMAYETLEIIEYTSIVNIINGLQAGQRGIIFTQQIESLKSFEDLCKRRGFNAISLWSTNNKKYPMNEEQIRVRNYLVRNSLIPDEYDILLINKAYETSINICNDNIDYMIIHDSSPDVIVQVRGRLRNDLKQQFNHTLKSENDNSYVNVPVEFLEEPLSAERRKELCQIIGLKNAEKKVCGWPTLRKKLIECKYELKESRVNGKRCVTIFK